MFRKLYYAIAGNPNEKALEKFYPIVEEVDGLEKSFEAKSDTELRAMTRHFQNRIQSATTKICRKSWPRPRRI